ncbi:hypothetical protein BH10BAC1_BH10BAC1_05780 [soil metagenome]
MKGNYVEIGIDGFGGFEGANTIGSPVPAGMHFRSGTQHFGFMANPQMNSWAGSAYDGDFFTPGSPENGWGFEMDTAGGTSAMSYGNNCSYLQQIPGAITSWSYSAPQTICEWEGDDTTTSLHFKIYYDLDDANLFYITTISITNNSSSVVPDLYYYRNLDPDNNESISGDFTTQNTIVSQISMGGTNTSVNATQALPWISSFAFLAIDSNWVAGYGGFSNRDASDMYNGVGYTQTVGATNLADESIYLAYKVSNLAPGNTQSFKFASIFDTTSVTSAITALSLSTVSINNLPTDLPNVVSVYPNPFSDNTTIAIQPSVQFKNAEMIVYNVIGKEMIRVKDIQSHEFKFEKNKLSTGMYLYKLMNDGQEIATGKLIMK